MKLKDLGDYFIGLTYKPESVTNEGTIVLRSGNIQGGKLDLSDIVRVNTTIREKQFVRPGDILMCSRNGSAKLVGKSTVIPDINEPMTFGAFMTVFRTPYNEYLRFFFQSDSFKKQLLSSKTTTINQITINMLDSIDIELPEKSIRDERCAILNRIQKVINTKEEELSALDDLIKARFVEMFGDGLEHKRLEEYTTLITKGASPKWQGIEYCDEGTLFVTSENVREGFVDLSKRKYLPDDINKILPRSVLRKNDILINIVGASIGRAAVYESDELANINQAVALVRLIPNAINKDFLLAFLNGEEAQKAYIAMKKGGARDNLSLKNIADLQIPVATVEQQNEFATFVAQVDKSKSVIQKSLDETQLMFDSLMQEYFG